MKKVWEYFENLNEIVYVSDVDSHEVVYANKKLRELYKIHSLEELKGRLCYELFHNCSEPCAICNDQELQLYCFKEWWYYNPRLDKHFVLKDTLIEDEGRRLRMEIALDADTRGWQGSMLHSYHNLEAMANEGLRIALQAPTPDKSIEVLLDYLGKALNGDRTYVFEQNEAGLDSNTYEWVAKGITSEKDHLQNLPPEVCANWYQSFSEKRNIVISNLEDIKETDPLQYQNLKRQNIQTLVVIPLYDDKKAIGFYGVDNPPIEALEYASDMLQVLGHFIVSSIKRRNLMKELEYMSYRDQLTKMGNRYAMNDYIENLKCGESIGIVYCDVTGLKRVNDTYGHEAGDRLILRACASLKKVFGKYRLYRIGGDELLALCARIEENVLKENLKLLKKELEENQVVMAVGAVWQKDCSKNTDMDNLLSEAERLMYEDKAVYYKTTGIDRRR